MSTADDKNAPVASDGGRLVDQSSGSEAHEVPAVGASPVPVVAAEAEMRGDAAALLADAGAAPAESETSEAMFQDTARFFLVIEDSSLLNRALVRNLKRAGASEGNVFPAENLAEVTAAIETLKGKEGVKEVVVICDMSFPLKPGDGKKENPRSGIEAIKQLQAYEAESDVSVSIIFNSSETHLDDEDREFIDSVKVGDTGGDKAGAVKAIRAMFEGRVSSKES